MRFTSALVAGALAVAVRAQTTTTESPSTTTWSLDPVQSSIIACLSDCPDDDVNCRADCNPVPRPNETQALDTIDCFAQCEQGNGTEEETAAYIQCTDKCVNDFFFQDGEGTPDNSASGSNDSTGTNTATDSAATETGTNSDSPTESGNSSPTESGSETSTETTGGSSSETPASGDDEGAATTLVGSILAGSLALILAL